ncbi:aspartate/glutamate racemase family protein [Desulforamulus ruminis]|uniref:Hydantoin racemase n=1 Tax=Desulforamulus ruminis (strain ATCC 23193 / DSM 2154 / NCIMB 8452 / DL) TaxID=696281 RepID=F6DK55_DESRL|nr:aspartate/glutamate racemase family protein [Desulforamulus ruminis]AEG60369.1 Hydantoin racemase [Desulforamulus ruminis DSM 2154]
MNRVLFLNPVGHDQWDQAVKDVLMEAKRDTTEVEVLSLLRGPHHLEYQYYEALVGPDMLHALKFAENGGFDAVVIGCFYDPFLHAAREIVDKMIVTAPCEAGVQIASTLGNRFSIIVGRKKHIPAMRRNVYEYGFKDKLASFRSLDLAVLELHTDEAATQERLKKEAFKAVEEDGAEVILLGCTVQLGFYKELQQELGVPVIDAVLAPFKHAEYLLDMKNRFGWSHSKKGGYEKPRVEEMINWGLEEQYFIQGLWTRIKWPI